MQRLPEVIGALDNRVYPGGKTRLVWHMNITKALSRHPEFVCLARHGGGQSVFQYDSNHRPHAKRRQKRKTDKSLNYVKAFRK